jgi:hypothetical protein
MTSLVETCHAVINGDFDTLWLARLDERLMTEMSVINSHTQNAIAYAMLMKEIGTTWPDVLTRDELYIILQFNVGNIPQTPNKFTSLLRHNGIETKRIRKNGVKAYGIEVKWTASAEIKEELEQVLKPVSTRGALKKVKG